MEFKEKIQRLRKQRNMTQEELAQRLYVSRTAISKWESGRGLPNIDSLKSISNLFEVSIDELMSGESIVALAESEQYRKVKTIRDLAFGVLDCLFLLLLFLPVFAAESSGYVEAIPLFMLTDEPVYIWLTYMILIAVTAVFGIVQLILQNCAHPKWLRNKFVISFFLSVLLISFALASRQPYPGLFVLCMLIAKGLLLIKTPLTRNVPPT